jgi:hypothetical protein
MLNKYPLDLEHFFQGHFDKSFSISLFRGPFVFSYRRNASQIFPVVRRVLEMIFYILKDSIHMKLNATEFNTATNCHHSLISQLNCPKIKSSVINTNKLIKLADPKGRIARHPPPILLEDLPKLR